MLNPKLGIGRYIINIIAVLIFLIGFQGGLIGGAIFGAIGYGFAHFAIRLLARYKNIEQKDLTIDRPEPTQEEIEKKTRIEKRDRKFWKVFLVSCAIFLIIVIVLTKLSS